MKMSKGQLLRALVKQRLSAAADEIFGLFERTIAEYEGELCRSKEENERQRQLLESVLKPKRSLQKEEFPADVQLLLVTKKEVLPKDQDWRTSLDEEPPEPPQINEQREEELWTSREEEQFEGMEEFSFTRVAVKTEEDEEKPQLHQNEQMKPDGEDYGAPEPAWIPGPHGTDIRTEDSFGTRVSDGGWREVLELPSGINPQKMNADKPLSCSECGKTFSRKYCLQIHKRMHTGEKPYSCSGCGKRFNQRNKFIEHTRRHTGLDMFSCALCGKQFAFKYRLRNHMATHTGEKPFSCSVCGKGLRYRGELVQHMSRHTLQSIPAEVHHG